MERAVYFDAWFHRQHNYHPGLPPRRLRMLDDLVDYRTTLLVWSALGGGSISLPYLEAEAFAEVPPRYRMYGFLNDREFIEECHKRAIKVFGVVFECQGWEFPAELSEGEDEILALNELRDAGRPGWLGLREFSTDRYPGLWPPIERYFPGGLVNSAGEPVRDLLEECASRDVYGEPCHTRWVECPDRAHYCFNMDRNNPVWREYLKAIIRIQVDAGVDGVHLDEAETPLTSLGDGGCFCRDCQRGFREYLRGLPEAERPVELAAVDLETFDYAAFLLARGHDFKTNRETAPLYWDYLRYQHRTTALHFAELADYARQYAASKGRSLLVSGNFFECLPRYYPYAARVDLVVTEMGSTGYRQPAWCRYVAGFAGQKTAVAVENPYGGVVAELLAMLQTGRGFDLFRMMTYEAAALGIDMSLPYGSWMGSAVEDAFYAPHELATEIGSFLAENEALFGRRTFNETAVVFSTESAFREAERLAAEAGGAAERLAAEAAGPPDSAGPGVSPGRDERAAFWQACERLVDGRQPFDVVMFPDGELRPDELTAADIARYRTLILPECSWLTAAQADLLETFADAGGSLVAIGGLGENLDERRRALLLAAPTLSAVATAAELDLGALPGGPQVALDRAVDCALNFQAVAAGAALHFLRYDYDAAVDGVPVLPELGLRLRLPRAYAKASAASPSGLLQVTLEPGGGPGEHLLRLRNVPLYGVVLLSD